MPSREVFLQNPFNHFDHQRTLFEFGSPARNHDGRGYTAVADRFRARGYALCGDVQGVQHAYAVTMELLSYLGGIEPYASLRFGDFLIAKADQIPVGERFVLGDFQCLHFDYGLPILPQADQAVYGVTALFMPRAAKSSGTITRMLPLNGISGTFLSVGSSALSAQLRRYASQNGDGWRQPTFVNTGRISIFLRFLDAMSPSAKFSQYIDVDSATFIHKCGPVCDSTASQWQRERELLRQDFGVDVTRAEQHIVLNPGDLLIFDNLRNVHGRLGRRASREVWQLLFGLPNTPPELIDHLIDYVTSAFAA